MPEPTWICTEPIRDRPLAIGAVVGEDGVTRPWLTLSGRMFAYRAADVLALAAESVVDEKARLTPDLIRRAEQLVLDLINDEYPEVMVTDLREHVDPLSLFRICLFTAGLPVPGSSEQERPKNRQTPTPTAISKVRARR